METISSSRNQRVLLWRSLKEKKGREEHGLFLVEGPKLVSEALLSGFSVNALLLRQGYMPPFDLPAGIPVYSLSDSVFQSVSDTRTPQGIAAVVHLYAPVLKGRRFLALDGIQDPGNLGTIVRTADAAGFEGILLSQECADLFSPKVIRATMGSIFRLSYSFPPSLPDALKALRYDHGFAVISSQLDGSPFYDRAMLIPPYILIIGNEGNGISEEVKAVATHRFRLPMKGGAESLNAAVAAGIMMYDLLRAESKAEAT